MLDDGGGVAGEKVLHLLAQPAEGNLLAVGGRRHPELGRRLAGGSGRGRAVHVLLQVGLDAGTQREVLFM